MLKEQLMVERIYAAVAQETGVSASAIKSRLRGPLHVSMARRIACRIIRTETGWTARQLAEEFGRTHSHIETLLYNKHSTPEFIERVADIENRVRAALRS